MESDFTSGSMFDDLPDPGPDEWALDEIDFQELAAESHTIQLDEATIAIMQVAAESGKAAPQEDQPHVLVMEFRCEDMAKAEYLEKFLQGVSHSLFAIHGNVQVATLGIVAESAYDQVERQKYYILDENDRLLWDDEIGNPTGEWCIAGREYEHASASEFKIVRRKVV